MKTAPGLTLPRVALAVALSILLHLLLLWQWPALEFSPSHTQLPQLQAKLEPLPKKPANPPKRKPKSKPASPAVIDIPALATDAASAAAPAEPAAAIATETTEAPGSIEQAPTHPALPKHAQLHFTVQYGSGDFKVGEIVHILENSDGRYKLQAVTQTTGLVGLFRNFRLSQTSSGSSGPQGLRPHSYIEVRSDSSGTQSYSADFDWDRHKITFSSGSETLLPDQAQDILSLPYQLSQLPLNGDAISVALSNGRNIARHFIAAGDEGSINTAMGELRTLTLSKVHGANEEGLIIWLALEYRLLPVKILYLDKSGAVSANMLITDIRVSDE